MDSDSHAPLLADVESSVAGLSQAHLCSRCTGELDSPEHRSTFETTPRHVFMSVAILFCIIIFGLLVGHFVVGHRPNVLTVFIVIWTDVTLVILAVLLNKGRRCHVQTKLGRTVTQIRALCALAVSWSFLVIGMLSEENSSDICRWRYNADCRALFTAAHVFVWLLIATLFAAAYATYRRAVAIHGSTMVPPSWTAHGSCLASFWCSRERGNYQDLEGFSASFPDDYALCYFLNVFEYIEMCVFYGSEPSGFK
ncbi:hypothetical protein MVEN_00770000 [Mycena venus]|uniref:MARVEL domain-containing protein n=1 Tax=Mycena venus TaxID=2733690 RepID=A0A8H7D689_9AGAR|nr:hypothetical protein MVEN_00770000 [Mycena venus]